MGGVRAVRATLAASLAAQGWLLAHFWSRPAARVDNLEWALAAAVLFLLSVLLLARARLRPRPAVLLVLGVGALLQIVALTSPPRTSDDDFRYLWDAKVQLAGTDPYRYAPVAPELAPLRDDLLFPADGACPHRVGDVCTRINRPTVHTIYPPVAEAAFAALRLASFGGHGDHLPLQFAAAAGTVLIGLLLARRVLARDGPVWQVALWSWCPVVVSEFGNNAHIDWLGVLFVVAAFGVLGRRPVLAGVLAGAAIATKLYPALVLPALLRRRPGAVLAAAGGVVVLGYVPHVAAVGGAVVGYLPGYLKEEQYVSGRRLMLLGQVLPHPVDTVAGVLVLAAVALWALRRVRTDPRPGVPERAAVVVVGTAFLVTTPNYGWYAALLLALIVLSGCIEWLPVVFAPTVSYLYRAVHLHDGVPSPVIWLVAALLTAGIALRRRAVNLRPWNLPPWLPFVSSSTARSPSSPSTARR